MTWRPWSLALLVILTSIGGAARAQPIGTDMAPGAPLAPQAPLAPGAPLVNIAPPVGAVGIPLGSTELGFRGLSPLGSAAAPGSAAAGSAACPGAAVSGKSPAPLFDGGGTGMSGGLLCGERQLAACRVELHGRRDWCSGIGRHRHSPRLRRDGTGRPQPTACRPCRAVVRPAARGRHATLHERGDAHAGRELLTTVD